MDDRFAGTGEKISVDGQQAKDKNDIASNVISDNLQLILLEQ